MVKLKEWLNQHGPEGRARLYAALIEKFPRTNQGSISNWSNGVRTPNKSRAEIISKVTGIPLAELSYRHVHLGNTPPRDPAKTIASPPG